MHIIAFYFYLLITISNQLLVWHLYNMLYGKEKEKPVKWPPIRLLQ